MAVSRVNQDKRGVLIKDMEIDRTIGSIQLSENHKNQVRQANRPDASTGAQGSNPKKTSEDVLVGRLVDQSREIPVEFHEETIENRKTWRIFWVDPIVENNISGWGSLITSPDRDVSAALPLALEMWNKELSQFNIRFTLGEHGIKVRIVGNNPKHQHDGEWAHNEFKNDRICIFKLFIEDADKIAACPKDTISGIIYSARNHCLFGSRDSDRISLYVRLLAHELGHEALDNLTEPIGGLMENTSSLQQRKLEPVEAKAFAQRVWKYGKKKTN